MDFGDNGRQLVINILFGFIVQSAYFDICQMRNCQLLLCNFQNTNMTEPKSLYK